MPLLINASFAGYYGRLLSTPIISFKTAPVLPTSTPHITLNGLYGVPGSTFRKVIVMAAACLSTYVLNISFFLSLAHVLSKQLRYTRGDHTRLLHPDNEVNPAECRYRDTLLPMAWLVGYDNVLLQRVIHSNLRKGIHFDSDTDSLEHWITVSTDLFLPNLLRLFLYFVDSTPIPSF
jgi:hypothetical protein